MDITYRDTKQFTPAQLGDLFASVGWMSAQYPQRLAKAMEVSATVITAWDGERLVGLANAIDDGVLTAYIHYLLVRPEYQGRGIGGALLAALKERYRDYLYLILISETEQTVDFYRGCGFEALGKSVPMAVMGRPPLEPRQDG